MHEINKSKFDAIKALNLPIDHYMITGSGPLGIRNLRAIGDIDIVVSSELWNILEKQHEVIIINGLEKITFPDGIVEAFKEQTSNPIAHAELIEGLPFESLENLLYFKRKMGREKDLRDIAIIEKFIKDDQE